MIKKMQIMLVLLITLAIVSCQKDSTEFVPDNNQSELITANIFGVVQDENFI